MSLQALLLGRPSQALALSLRPGGVLVAELWRPQVLNAVGLALAQDVVDVAKAIRDNSAALKSNAALKASEGGSRSEEGSRSGTTSAGRDVSASASTTSSSSTRLNASVSTNLNASTSTNSKTSSSTNLKTSSSTNLNSSTPSTSASPTPNSSYTAANSDVANSGAVDVRAVVVVGAGRAFSTGRDLKESRTHSRDDAARFQDLVRASADAWQDIPVPTIAAIHGPCWGWGLELALACDLRVAATDAQFRFPECALGIFPGAGGIVRMPRLVGPTIAKELIFTARTFTSAEAYRWQLLNRVADAGKHLDVALQLADAIAANGPLGVASAKAVLNDVVHRPHDDPWPEAHARRKALNDTADFAEALAAFEQKRAPVFQGR